MQRNFKAVVTPEVLEYLAEHARQDEVLAKVERETAELPNAMMQVSVDQGSLLELLTRLIGAQAALEIGTFTGYSAICIARGLGEGGRLTCLELSEEYAATAQRYIEEAGLDDRVEIKVGPAEETLAALPEEPAYDLVFIDADKEAYPVYYEGALTRLKPGGLMLLDNMLLRGRVVEPEDERSRIVSELNDRIAVDERVDAVMALVADGLTFVRKR
jgi:caffeoyl-CoA O-methyltransferase